MSENAFNIPVASDEKRLKQILINIIRNSIKFTQGRGKRIGLRVKRTPGYVELEIEDEGVGIEPED